MQKQEVTIYDVAREAGVSMATVSRVVNGNTNVRKETRDKVSAVIERLHYQPNAVAQGLASKKTTTVGLIVPGLTNLHFAELSKGIDDIASMYKYNIILSSVENNLLSEEKVIQGLLNKQVDGVIYMSNSMSNKAREAFARTNTPVVLAGTIDESNEFGSVSIDFKTAENDVFNLFYKDGKRKLALAVGDEGAFINKGNRIVYYKEFLEKNNLGAANVYDHITSYEDGYELADKLLADNVDAIMVTRDLPAAGLVNALTDKGIKIPEQLEIVSATSTNIAKVVRPHLTTVQQPLYDIGAVAMRMLTKLMNKEELDEKHISLGYTLQYGQTTLNK
ncbi:LacI family transcriptional regulator [Lactobacillus colini]|uniref:LacI family transcriptional regulator n=1 Tax=Lactobacillus colini TaxID=1819254 RepID=A0ABS4MFX5_9LACO|nr:substrate-binding domain-containing protein [Lactobacillus colini]MBP2058583.1 LacI family transcriptional regulator [Lactobacillus colini]